MANIRCEMLLVRGPDDQDECGGEATCEVEGGAACSSCRERCEEEGLEILPLGTEMIYSTGKTAFDHARQYDHNDQAACVIKAVAAMIAYNERTRSP